MAAATPAAATAPFALPEDDDEAIQALLNPPPGVTREEVLYFLSGRIEAVHSAMQRGTLELNFELEDKNGHRHKLIHLAAQLGLVPLLRLLIFELGVDPNERNMDGNTPLILALARSSRAALFLIEDVPGCDVNARGQHGMTPFMVAAASGSQEICVSLANKGADVNARDVDGWSTLMHSLSRKQEAMALLLLDDMNAAWDVKTTDRASILDVAAANGTPLAIAAIVRHMRAAGLGEAEVRVRVQHAAHFAVRGRAGGASLPALVEAGLVADAPVAFRSGQTTLSHLACQQGNQPAAEFVNRQGCCWIRTDSQGRMPHHMAAIRGHVPILEWVARAAPGPVLREPTAGGFMPGCDVLHLAATFGQLAVVEWLIGLGWTPLLEGVSLDGVVRLPAAMAARSGHQAVAAFLEAKEAEVRAARAAARAEEEAVMAMARAAEEAVAAEARAAAEVAAAQARAVEEAPEEAVAQAAQAAAQAAARRARNDRRRQKQKKAKARRRGQGGEAAPEAEEDVAQEEDEEYEFAVPDFDVAEAAVGGAAAPAGKAAKQEEKEQQEQEQPLPEEKPAALDEALGAAAAAVSAPSEPPSPAAPPLLLPLKEYLEEHAPHHLLCPVTLQLLDDPVVLGDGITYSRASIERHFAFRREHGMALTSPQINEELDAAEAWMVPNVAIRSLLLEYKEAATRKWQALAEAEAGAQQG